MNVAYKKYFFKTIFTVFLTSGFFIFLANSLSAALVPNDPLFEKYQRPYFEQVRIPQAWSITTGAPEIVIAVIDTGVDFDHPDLIGNIKFNRNEIPLNGIDDDGNGFVDDFHGWDFLEESSDPHPKFETGDNLHSVSHGTAVSGIVASDTNNNEGLAGVCWNCKILPIRALDSKGQGNTYTISKAIDYAVSSGAHIINMSFVGSGLDDYLLSSLRRAYDSGALMVAAIGNDATGGLRAGGDLDLRPLYPVCASGSLGESIILGVGSVDSDNKKSNFSNYGFTCVDINAPGNGLAAPQVFDPQKGADFDSKYRTGWIGTSFATPIVSGVAGLMKSINPKLTNNQIISIIRETATDISQQNPDYIGKLGGGLLNAEAAVKKASETQGLGDMDLIQWQQPRESFSKGSFFAVPTSGIKVQSIEMDIQGTVKSSFLAYPEFFKGGARIVTADINGDGNREIIFGAGPGGGPQVRIFNSQGRVVSQFFAYDSSFRGGVYVAAADTNNDGKHEIITSAGSGLSSEIRIFDSSGNIKSSFVVRAEGLSGGVTVSAGDLTGDGNIEIVTGTGGGSLPLVQVFDIKGNKKASWLAYPEFFKGGVNVALGDLDGDGILEIITSAGVGGGPQIRIFSADGKVLGQFFAMEESFRGGATVASGRIDGEKYDKIIVGSGPGRSPEIRIFRKFGVSFVQERVFSVFDEGGYKSGINVGI